MGLLMEEVVNPQGKHYYESHPIDQKWLIHKENIIMKAIQLTDSPPMKAN
jgi:hypothetical protein